MQTEIINIGDELLIGQVVNTNASWMAEQLDLAGFPVRRIIVVPDDPSQILESLREAEQHADLILITGGLGPTKDDLTKETLCRYFSTKLVFHASNFASIEKSFKARRWAVTDVNRRQAEVPENCIVIPNKNGTAPGMWFEKKGKDIEETTIFISMPGVPFELKAMITGEVIPRLKQRFNPTIVLHHTVLTQGMGESSLSDILEDWETHLPSWLHLAYLPQPGIVRLRLTGKGENEQELRDRMDKEVDRLRQLIPDYIFGEGDETLEAIVGNLLKKTGHTLATAESCTGGYIAHLVTSIPGSSSFYLGSIIAYANEIKISELGVSRQDLLNFGAVSEEIVRQMAGGIRQKFGSDYAISTSGIAGPDGGTAEKPVGLTWIAIAGPNGIQAYKYLFGDSRERNIRRTALQALNLLRKTIVGS